MFGRRGIRPRRANERGSTLLIVALAMVGLLAVCAFAIDLANFYLARAEAQRAADAAALAGATIFVNDGCTNAGCVSGGPQEAPARQQAEWIGDQNYIAGKAASIQDGDVTFSYPSPQEPQVTVVARSSVPTFFAKIFGISTANVSASATAEAYNPSGGNAPVAVACLKPFLLPNCDPTHTTPTNSVCTGGTTQGYFFNPNSSPPYQLAHPGVYPAGIIGMPWALHTNAVPSQWYLVGFDGAPPSSGSALRDHIAECTPEILSCGSTLTTANGKKVGPTTQGTEALINANGDGLNQGQDSINTSDTTTCPGSSPSLPIFPITGGANNPNPSLVGKIFCDYSESPSVATVPVYTGGSLTPGGSNITVVGYMQVFIQQADHNKNSDDVDVIILNASGCGGSPGGGGGGGGNPTPIVAAGGSAIPIRLIRTN
jgi:Putative Flp pilus-assembly TadE/G-like